MRKIGSKITLLILFFLITGLKVSKTVFAEGNDWVSIVSLTPNHYDNYEDPVTFTATINYCLESKDQGVVYLGFNEETPNNYDVNEVESDHIVVSKGIGTVTLSRTVTPVNWDTVQSRMQQYMDGRSDVITDFKVYANISEYPHDIPWTPLAITEAVITEVPEYNQTAKIQYMDGKQVRTEDLNTSFEKAVFEQDSKEYSPQLAHLFITLCNAVHEKEAMERSFLNMGFSDFDLDYSLNNPMLAYAFAKKELHDGTTLVLVVLRGTSDLIETGSNLDIISLENKRHKGFSDAAEGLKTKLRLFLGTDDYSNMRFAITGHSRGAAASNLLSSDLIRGGISPERLVSYNFACPDVEKMTDVQAEEEQYSSIFNIGHVSDFVSWVPGAIFNDDSHQENEEYWNKYGKSYWFAYDWEDEKEVLTKNPFLFVMDRINKFHLQGFYLNYLRKEVALTEYKNRVEANAAIRLSNVKRQGRLAQRTQELIERISIFCPVDFEIYEASGARIAYTKDDIPYYENGGENLVKIYVQDDKKRAYIVNQESYRIILKGRDRGTMQFSVESSEDGNDFKEIRQRYENVQILNGKSFKWEKASQEDLKETKLLLLDSASKQELAEIQADGTELALDTVSNNNEDTENMTIKESDKNRENTEIRNNRNKNIYRALDKIVIPGLLFILLIAILICILVLIIFFVRKRKYRE